MFIRPGLSPAAVSRAAAVSGPSFVGGQQRRVGPFAETADLFVDLCDLCVQVLVSAGQVP